MKLFTLNSFCHDEQADYSKILNIILRVEVKRIKEKKKDSVVIFVTNVPKFYLLECLCQ